MVNWNGTFLPTVGAFLQKHIRSVEFRPLKEMTRADWDVLDWPNLRSVPRRRIQEDIVNGKLDGFHVVNIDMSKVHGGKERYFWPGTRGTVFEPGAGAFDGWDQEVKPLEQFEDEAKELEDLSEDQLRSTLASDYGFDRTLMIFWERWALVLVLLAVMYAKEKYDEDSNNRGDWTA